MGLFAEEDRMAVAAAGRRNAVEEGRRAVAVAVGGGRFA
jgi:hypothetical protein